LVRMGRYQAQGQPVKEEFIKQPRWSKGVEYSQIVREAPDISERYTSGLPVLGKEDQGDGGGGGDQIRKKLAERHKFNRHVGMKSLVK